MTRTQQRKLVDAPDGGWGWLVTVASFLVTFLMRGSEAAMTVVYVKFLSYFEAGGAVTSGIISVFTAANFSAALFAAFLSKKYGMRKVAMFGGVLSFAAFIASSLATGIVYLYISLGVFAGTSFGLVLMPTMVALGRYFKKRYVIASSLSLSGQGVGAFVMPPLCQYLLDRYGWRGTLLIFAPISANMCLAAALLRPIHLVSDENGEANPDDRSPVVNDKGPESAAGIVNTIGEGPQELVDKPENSEDKPSHEEDANERIDKSRNRRYGFVSIFREVPLFGVLIVYFFLYSFGCSIVFTHFVDTAIRKGMGNVDAAFLLSIMGIVTCVVSIATGFLLDCCGVKTGRIYTHIFGVALFGVAAAVVPISTTYVMLVATSTFMGIGRGMFSALDPVVIKEVVGVQRMTEGFGITAFLCGLGFLTGPPLSGYFFDKTGSYNTSFYIAAAVLVGAVLVMLIPLRCIGNRTQTSTNETNT